MVQMRE